MFCTECGVKVEAGVKFCQECGGELSHDNNYCSECGTQLDKDSNFCISCGNEVDKVCGSEAANVHLQNKNVTSREKFLAKQSSILEKQNKYLAHENETKKNDENLNEEKTGKCTHCSQVIEFKLKDEGSLAVCPYCSKETELIIDLKPPNLWNPNLACLFSIILTPIFGALVYQKNWEELGSRHKALQNSKWIGSSIIFYFIYYLVISFFINPYTRNGQFKIIISGLSVLFISYILWYLIEGVDQRRYLREHFDNIYIRKPIILPLIGCTFLVIALCFIFYLLRILISELFHYFGSMDALSYVVFGLIVLIGVFAFLRAKLSNLG